LENRGVFNVDIPVLIFVDEKESQILRIKMGDRENKLLKNVYKSM
jgi:hypothetical protein